MNATSASFDTFVCNDWPLAKCCAMAAGPDGRFVDNCISLLCSVCEPKLFRIWNRPKEVPNKSYLFAASWLGSSRSRRQLRGTLGLPPRPAFFQKRFHRLQMTTTDRPSKIVGVRFTRAERKAFDRAAKKAGLSLSNYLRKKLGLSRKP